MSTNYECFRNDVASNLADLLDPSQLSAVMAVIDQASMSYDVIQKTTDLIVADEIPRAVQYYMASKALENVSKSTLKNYSYILTNFFQSNKKRVQDITANDIRCFLAQKKLEGKISDQTIDLYRRILSSFFSWLVNNEYIDRNPCAPIANIKYQANERQPLSGIDLEKMRDSCIVPKEKALIDFLYTTGCRVSECSAALLSDIDWVNRSVLIRHGKGDKRRTVYFNAETEVSLRKYLATRSDDCDAIFIRERHGVGPLSTRSIEETIKRIAVRANISAKCTPHVLRHTFATTGLRAGITLDKLQALMGHTKPETTLIYAKQDNIDLQRAHQVAFT